MSTTPSWIHVLRVERNQWIRVLFLVVVVIGLVAFQIRRHKKMKDERHRYEWDHFKETREIEDSTGHSALIKELERRETGDGDSSEAQQLRESR